MATQTDYLSTIQKSDGLVKAAGRSSGPNPLAGVVARTRTEGPLSIPVANADQAKEVTNLLRRDAKNSDSGLSLQYKNGRGEKVEVEKARSVHFVAKDLSERAYTVEDIRRWHGYPKGRKLTDLDRVQYRIAANLDSKRDRELYEQLTGESAEDYRQSFEQDENGE